MIALTTPTGTIGSKVLRRLTSTSASVRVRVLVRDRGRLPEHVAGSVEIVEGSLHAPADLLRLAAGASALFWCQPDAVAAEDYYAAYDALAEKGRAAIRESGVPRVVAISAAGGTPARPAGPITALHRMEKILASSGAACRFLRCGSFLDNLLWQWDSIIDKGVFTYAMDGHVRGPQVCAADIARVAAEGLQRSDWAGVEALQLLGPGDLSYHEMAEILTRELKRPVVYEEMEAGPYREILMSLGSTPSAARALTDMFAWLENGYHVPPGAPRADTPTTLATWLQRD